MPGRIDNDIKNRFNASLRKYKTFEQYLEANDRKRDKSKKKYNYPVLTDALKQKYLNWSLEVYFPFRSII